MFVTYFFILLLLQRVEVVLLISSDTIAHFKCCNCDPYPNDCCIGSLILPYIILTSAYCAENCKVVLLGKTKNVSIIRFYMHPHYRNYVLTGSRSIIKRNDVALVQVTDDPDTERPYLKLSGLQVGALDGRKGLFPVFDNLRPILLRTIVQRCRRGTSMSSMGYVVCTVNKSLNSSNPCQHQQGVPLLVEGKIIGLSGFVDKLMCINEQRYFMAVGPALLWIRSVIQNVSQHHAHQQHARNTNKYKEHYGTFLSPSVVKAIIKTTYYVTIKKNTKVLDRNPRVNSLMPPPYQHISKDAITTAVIPETENYVNVDQDSSSDIESSDTTTTAVIYETEIPVKLNVDQDTTLDTYSSEQQDANNLLEAIDVSQIESPMYVLAVNESAEITSTTFPTTNILNFLSQIGYRPGNGNYFGYSFRKSFQNVT